MNEHHRSLCPSPEWAESLRTEVLAPLAAGVSLGEDMLEIGPGPGAATTWLRERVRRLVAVESDGEAADALAVATAGSNVEVVVGDATAMDFPDASFDAVGCFTMLHHVPTTVLQNRLLAEVLRVLRPGGVLLASDSLASDSLHRFHEGDVYNPIDPATLVGRLLTLGFARLSIGVDRRLTWTAHKPVEGP